jgi:hypothetical protein
MAMAVVVRRTPAPAFVEDAVARTFGVETILPTQFARGRACSPGPVALCAAILASALEDAGVTPRRATPPRPSTAYARQAAACARRRRATA